MKKALFILLLALLCVTKAYGQATDVYLTQTGAATTGCTLTPRYSVAQFNVATNWGIGGTNIGPGTTIHACGAFTGAANSNLLTFQGSGTSGSPITLHFETGAVMSAPYWSFGSGAINITGRSFIVIDGGTNGILQNTDNGTNLGNHQASAGIVAAPCTNCIIKNLTIQNMYVQVQFDGTGTNLNLSPGGSDQSSVNAIQIGGSNWAINNNTINDCGWCLREFYGNGDANIDIHDNNIFHFDHAWAFAAPGANAATNVKFHDNQIHDPANWDCGFNTASPPQGFCHHDGIHSFSNSGSSSINGFYVYGNYFYGNWGQSPTGFVFIEGGGANANMSNDAWWNNVFVVPTGSVVNTNGWFDVFSGISGSAQVYNNTVIGPNATDNTACAKLGSIANLSYKNNVTSPCGGPIDMGTLSNFDGVNVDFNLYGPSCQNGANCFVWNGAFRGSFPNWRAAGGCAGNGHPCDTNSTQNNTTALSATGVPQAGSPAINAGTNLTSLCTGNLVSLCSDTSLGGTRTPTTRSATGNWTIGAYNASGATSPALSMSPNPAAFGNVNVGSNSSPITVTVTSTGTATATLGSPIANFSDPQFSNIGTGTCVINQSLSVGSSCTVIIRFTPTSAGAKSGTMLVGANTSTSINLSGTGIALTPVVSISPSPIAFGSVTQGTTSSPLTVTVSNTGTGTLTLANPFFVISGTNAADFARTGGTCANAGTVAPAASCTLTMTFHPVTTAAESGLLTINGNATGTANLSGVGVAPTMPIVSVTPNPVAFGNQVQSTTSAAMTVTVTNTGSANLVLATPFFTFTGANPGNFARAAGTCANGGTVTPSSTCTITVTFTPNILGARAATLNILGNANGSTSLTGTGIAPATPVVTISPSPIAFGNVTNGTTSSPLTVTVTNTGSASLTLNTPFFTITGTNASEFARTGGSCANGGTVAVSGTCTLTMTFSPAATGARTATLNINGNASGTAPLTGTGQAVSTTSMSITPSSFDFGNVPQHVASTPKQFTITNTGTTTLTLATPVTSFGGAFVADWSVPTGTTDTCGGGTVLTAGQTCTKTVVGTPSTIGLETGTFIQSATTTSATINIQMTGTGSSSIQIAPAALNFPNTTVGTTSAALTETVTNTGTLSVTLSTPFFVISGTNAADFARAGGTCTNGQVLGAGVTCTVTVTFTPTINGPENGLLTVNSATASGNSALQGTGVLPTPIPGIALAPAGGVAFGSQVVGTTSSVQTVTVSSTGTANLVLNTPYFTITGTNAADVTNTGAGSCANGASLTPGSTCTITLTFNPAGAGARVATLNVAGNANGSLALSGTGIAAVVTLTSAPNPVAFGSVTQSTTSAVQTVTVTNTGNITATLQTPYYTLTGANSADFSNTATGTCTNGGTLAVAASCTVKLTFTPSLVAAETATLTVSTTGAVSTTDALSGTGVAPAVPSISIAPDPAAFGNQNVSSTSGSTTITITNSGTATLILNSPFFTFAGTNATDFARSGGTCINGGTVATSTSCTIFVTFTPSAAGARTATLNISGNASKSSNLTGTGVATAAILTLTPNPVNYGVVIQGSSSITTLTLQNTGTAQTTLLTPFALITGANASDFTRLGGTCINGQILAINGSCSIIVAFTPTTNTAETATLSVSGLSVTGTATLNGTGQAQPNLPAPSVLIISQRVTRLRVWG